MIVSFVGPIAAGKTTERQLVRDILRDSNHVVSLTYPPFAFLTYGITSLFKAAMLGSVPPRDRSKFAGKDPISFIEIRNPLLMRRVISALVQIDLIQLLFVVPVLRFASRLRVAILIEDFIPTIYVDHNTYLTTYKGIPISRSPRIRKLHAIVRNPGRLSRRDFCVYLWSTADERQRRSEARGFRVTDTTTLHDAARGDALRSILPWFCKSVLACDTTRANPETLARRIVEELPLSAHI